MTFHEVRHLGLIACALVLAALAGCQGSGNLNATALTPDAPEQQTGPAELPEFPLNDLPGDEPRLVADADNIQEGRNTWRRSAEGATDQADSLVLASAPPPIAWGMWRWGVFTGAIVPQNLRFESDVVDESVYWALLSNYATGTWEVYGPLDAALHAHVYPEEPALAADYISPAGYTYVAVVVEGGDSTVIGGLNLITNEGDVNPPAAPMNLAVEQTRATSIDLTWTANTEADLDNYTIYSGPSVDFTLDDPSLVDHGDVAGSLSAYTVGGLDPETEYNFRITASDELGNESPLSNTATGTTTAMGEYQPPSNLAVANLAGSWAEISYDEPTDPAPLGYEFYTGPSPSFELGQPGVVKRHTGVVTDNPFRMEGLESETEYYCRARALYLGTNWSDLSDPVTFTTILGTAPSPDFFTIPAFVQVGVETTFDPSLTTDDDTPLESLTFTWDFENDGTPDAETTGPDQVTHTYPERGEVQCKLTASDGTAVSIVRDISVSFQFDYQETVAAIGQAATVVAVDVIPGDDRVAMLMSIAGTPVVRYYNGSSWVTIDVGSIGASYYLDIALNPSGVSLLTATGGVTWTVYESTGGSWSSGASATLAGDNGLLYGGLGVDTNGRVGVCLITGIAAFPSINISANVWHEKSDSTFNTAGKQIGINVSSPTRVRRNTTTTYAIYVDPDGTIQQWSLTDSSNSDQSMQAVSGVVGHVVAGMDPSNNTHVFWAAGTDGSRVYYGDNYGTSNGSSQYYSTPAQPTGVAGVGLKGDNEALFYWTSGAENASQTLYGYDTTAGGGSGQQYSIVSGYDAAFGGYGAYMTEGANTGVYAVVSEKRDGELTGRFIDGGTVNVTETLYAPSEAQDIGDQHVAITFADGGILALASQNYPTARSGYATTAGQSYTLGDVGIDTYATPWTGCRTSTADEYFVGTYTADDQHLLLNRFTLGTPEGTQEEDLTGTGKARLVYNETTNAPLVCYTTNSGQNLSVRTWNGTAWSAATQIYSGSSAIESLMVADDPDGEWGVAFIDAAENTRLIETSGGGWGSAQVLSTATVFGFGGIGLDYHADGHMSVAVERSDAPAGIYLGHRPDGGSITWNQVDTTGGNKARSIYTFYTGDSPVVLYYLVVSPNSNSRMHLVELDDSDWISTELPFHMHCSTSGGAAPVSAILDASDNIVMCGFRQSGDPRYAAVAILYN